jgi:hypothetical protein
MLGQEFSKSTPAAVDRSAGCTCSAPLSLRLQCWRGADGAISSSGRTLMTRDAHWLGGRQWESLRRQERVVNLSMMSPGQLMGHVTGKRGDC